MKSLTICVNQKKKKNIYFNISNKRGGFLVIIVLTLKF